ncbi:NrsF family protein [Stenotrophomonas sp. 24(2023)]|uniref:NrsF family protein n=1 Tax=Stenotrophomonas sp. 24(2023) TaxID=3068324 RepID=UPI0027E11931|nr:NrsF family protein [Stenotrophomonas sp. 24(2023)]WMJ69354.1 NrsF family protein [Stenotrophomonas sp. 24(2023)]
MSPQPPMTGTPTTPADTAALVARLAAEPATPAPAGAMARRGWAVPLALLAALAVVLGVAGARPDLAGVAGTGLFAFKIACMGLLSLAAAVLVHRAGQPGVALRPLRVVWPLLLVLLAGLLLDRSGYPLLGASTWSVARCVGTIVLAALPVLAGALWWLRAALPTRPAVAGALAGVLAGAMAALAYTVACLNDGAAFVALWYHVAVLLVAALGALAGRIVLRW